MLHFKNVELADKYNISEATVRNWLKDAAAGKLELELYKADNRVYVANTASNLIKIEKLVRAGKKYRNTRTRKVATPKKEFYNLFSRKQVLDIINNLGVHREIPRQYNYFDGGADNWDTFVQRMWEDDAPNLLKSTVELVHANLGALDMLCDGYSRINIIDIGPGNARPVKELLQHFKNKGILHRYIALDISESMLRITERNIKTWFKDEIKVESYVRDITYERFDDLLVDDMLDGQADQTLNIALFFGATPMNFRTPSESLKVINSSLGQDDLLLYTDKPDSEADRRYFDFNPVPGVVTLSPNHRFIFDLLNIDSSLYEVEMGFNEQKRVRYIQVRLKKSLTIQFKFENGERHVDIDKGESILLWRAWHLTGLEIVSKFEAAGFALLQSSLTRDRQYLLTISGVNSKASLEA